MAYQPNEQIRLQRPTDDEPSSARDHRSGAEEKRRPMEDDEAASQSHRQRCVSLSSKTKRSVATKLLLGLTCLVALCCSVTLLLCGAVFFCCCWYVSAGRRKINEQQKQALDDAANPPGATAREQPAAQHQEPSRPRPHVPETAPALREALRSMKIEQELLVTNDPPAGAMAPERPAAAGNRKPLAPTPALFV